MKNLSFVLILGFTGLFAPHVSCAQYVPEKSFAETYAYGCDLALTGYLDYPDCGVVIALSGLKLRITPSFNAKTLAVIPFGETIERTEKGYDLKPKEDYLYLLTPDSVRGYWQEITWRGKKGFAFSAFIGDAIYKMKDEGYLLFENEGWCWNDCYASPAYHYYGVFTNRDSSRWELQKIKPSFVHIDDGLHGTMIKSNAKQPSAFILVSKKPLAEGLLLTAKKKATIFSRTFQPTEKEGLNTVAIPISQFSIAAKTLEDRRVNLVLTEKSTGRKQVIGSDFYCDVIELVWSGDLDQDGIMDFMLSYATENAFGCQLFLSSAAHGKQLVKPLKIYWYGDCC
ncbi:MAG: hypothetical protein KA138_14630 [Saprospiraceae bacterium]|nr:hypothetical protein [Saprospiraceae bacterium]